MSIDVSPENPTVVLHGLDWDQCQKVMDAIGNYHPRLNYDGYSLEMRRILHGVSWDDYASFLQALGDYHLRHTYDGWTLEMMSPRKDHDWVSQLIGRFIEQMTYDLDVSIQSVGSMTLSNPDVKKGVQPDQGYYVSHEAAVRQRLTYDPTIDPPPDLIIEVDVTNSSVPRMETFAALAIPEVWRHDDGGLHFYRLNESGNYTMVDRSGEFPWLEPADVLAFVERHGTIEENHLVREFSEYSQKRYQSWRSNHPKS